MSDKNKAAQMAHMTLVTLKESFAQDDPLALGMVDALAAVGIPAFGPDKAAARIEASKVFNGNQFFVIKINTELLSN